MPPATTTSCGRPESSFCQFLALGNSVHGMIEWFARNGVAANLMMVFIVASGLLAATSANEEVFPEMELRPDQRRGFRIWAPPPWRSSRR